MTLLAFLESRLPVGSSARQDGRLVDQRPGNGGTLHFSTGELARLVAEAIPKAEPAEQFPRFRPDRLVWERPASIAGRQTFSSTVKVGSRLKA
jgi:hypothetical protein